MSRRFSGISTAEAFGSTSRVLANQSISPSGLVSAAAFGVPFVANGRQFVYPVGTPSNEVIGALKAALGISPSGIITQEAIGAAGVTIWHPSAHIQLSGWWPASSAGSPWTTQPTLFEGFPNYPRGNTAAPTYENAWNSPPFVAQGGSLVGKNLSGGTVTYANPPGFSGSTQSLNVSPRSNFILDYNWDGHGTTNIEWSFYCVFELAATPPSATLLGTSGTTGRPQYSPSGGWPVIECDGWGMKAISTAAGNRVIWDGTIDPSDVLPSGYNIVFVNMQPFTGGGFFGNRVRYKVNSGSWTQVDAANGGALSASTTVAMALGNNPTALPAGTSFNGQFAELGIGVSVNEMDQNVDFLRRYANWAYGLSL